MNDNTRSSSVCESTSPLAMDLALGTLTGRDRSRVLDHVASCSKCRAELDAWTTVTDQMLALSPEAEPPLGFEARLVQRYHAESSRQTNHRRQQLVAVAAGLVLMACFGFVVGKAVSSDRGSSRTASASHTVATRLTSQGKEVGQVFLTTGTRTWIYMTIDDGNRSSLAWCQVTLSNGHVKTVGRFTISGGYGAWAAAIDTGTSRVVSAQVVDARWKVLASATVPA